MVLKLQSADQDVPRRDRPKLKTLEREAVMGSPYPEQPEQTQEKDHNNDPGKPPPPPEPSSDSGIVPDIKSPQLQGLDHLTPETVDIFTLDPVAALKLLCRGVQLLVDMTGDCPSTPFHCLTTDHAPGDVPPTPAIQGSPTRETLTAPVKQDTSLSVPGFGSRNENEHIDGVPFVRTPIGSPEAHMHEPIVHGSTSQSPAVQYAALVRKFYSKRPPPISLEDYLTRMHKYCPMSTAVYLATSHYITRIAIKEKLCPVTPRNVHRLVLAGLRTAMKALEDLSWPHGRFAKVGGISEVELGRLEVGFCFLMDFSLKVDARMLTEEAQHLVQINNSSAVADHEADIGGMQLKLPEPRNRRKTSDQGDSGNGNANENSPSTPRSMAEKRKASSSLPMRPVQHVGQGIGIVGQS